MPVIRRPTTFGVGTLVVLIAAIAGAILVIVNPHELSFATYFQYLIIGGGITTVGHGLDNGTGSTP